MAAVCSARWLASMRLTVGRGRGLLCVGTLWPSERWPLTRTAAACTDEAAAAEVRWSRKVRHSPGGNSPVSMWREAARRSGEGTAQPVSSGDGIAGGETVLGFGKYRELTYQQALQRDPAYCEGILRRVQSGGMDEDFVAFARYVNEAMSAHKADEEQLSNVTSPSDSACDMSDVAMHAELVDSGKYAGRSFSEVLNEDPDYCSWLVEQTMRYGKRSSPFWPFVAYILYSRQ